LLVVGSPATAFAVNAATFAVSAICLLRVRRGPAPKARERAATKDRVLRGWRALTGDRTVAVIAAGLVAVSFAAGATGVLFVEQSVEWLGTGAHGYGYLAAAVGVGGFLGSLAGDRLAAHERVALTVAVALAASGAAMVGLSGVRNAPLAWLLAAVFGAGYVLLEIFTITLLQRCLDSEVLGQASGTLDAATFGAVLLGAALMAPIVETLGLVAATIVSGAPALAAALLTAWFVRRLTLRSDSRLDRLEPRVRLLGHVSALVGANRPALEQLANVARPDVVSAGSIVIRQGEPARDFYVVVDGTYDVESTNGHDRAAHLARLGRGDYFGEIGLLEGWPRTATVRAATDGTVLRIPGADFMQVVTAAPPVAGALRMVASMRLADVRAAVPTLTAK
jgi:CRP-like cAMP-binding protein